MALLALRAKPFFGISKLLCQANSRTSLGPKKSGQVTRQTTKNLIQLSVGERPRRLRPRTIPRESPVSNGLRGAHSCRVRRPGQHFAPTLVSHEPSTRAAPASRRLACDSFTIKRGRASRRSSAAQVDLTTDDIGVEAQRVDRLPLSVAGPSRRA